MVDGWVQLKTRKSVLNRLRNECKKEFLRHHPEMTEFNLTDNFMLDKVTKYYLENEVII